jgi:hypothetical protein
MATKTTVSVWYDDRPGVEAGWVIRTTDYEDGSPVMGRIAMDDPIDSETANQARQIAAAQHGINPDDVIVLR